VSKRYAYWRSPSGHAAKGDPAKHAPVAVLKQLGEISEPRPDGAIAWNDFSFHRFESALRSAFVVVQPSGEELNEHDARQILHGAIVAAIKSVGGRKALPEHTIREEADKKASAFFRKSPQGYTLVASLSVASLPFASIDLAGCEVSPLRSRKRYQPPEVATRDSVIKKHLEATRYSLVKVAASGRSEHEAAARSIFAVDLLRAFWSFFSTPSWSISFGRRKPIGVIYPGPLYTLHDSGRKPFETYWYDKHVREDRELYKPDDAKWRKIEENRRWCARRLRGHPFRHDLEGLIVRYVEAVDQPDFDVAFLKMWSILEQVTDSIGEYDETIRRAGRNYSDHELVRGILQCLRTRRNLYVHSARESEDPDQAVYLVKQIVESHLIDLLRNPDGVRTIEEYAKGLTRSQDLSALRKEHRDLGIAIRALERRAEKGGEP
jgi:hypothetical protein